MKLKIFTLLLLSCSVLQTLTAQEVIDGQEVQITRSIREKIYQLNNYIAFLSDKKKRNPETMQYYKEKALSLFIGQGNEYLSDSVQIGGVIIETTSPNKQSVSRTLVRKYFDRMIHLGNSNIEIVSVDVPKLKTINYEKLDNDQYLCTFQYSEVYTVYRDGRIVCKDTSTRQIKSYVYTSEEDCESIVLLGDIKAIEARL